MVWLRVLAFLMVLIVVIRCRLFMLAIGCGFLVRWLLCRVLNYRCGSILRVVLVLCGRCGWLSVLCALVVMLILLVRRVLMTDLLLLRSVILLVVRRVCGRLCVRLGLVLVLVLGMCAVVILFLRVCLVFRMILLRMRLSWRLRVANVLV